MKRNFTQILCSLLLFFSLGFLINPTNINAQNCAVPTGISTSNISNFTATANWIIDNNVDHYRIRYKEVGTTTWNNKNNILNSYKIINNLSAGTSYSWQVMAYCSSNNSNSSWSVADTFMTINFALDCNNTLNGTAFIDSCGNCVGGITGNVACIPFTPFVSVSLSNTDCDSLTDLTINNSQDPNEPDMLNSSFSSDGGSFTISSMNVGDTIGSVVMSAMGGAINLTSSLVVASIPSSSQAIIESIDNSTGITLPGTFTISNTTSGVLIVTDSIYDNNTTTSGNSSSIIFSNIFTNPQSTTLSFTSTINSELGDVDVQTFLNTISCGIPFTPFVSVSLSNTDCDSLTDLTINNSQDPNEPDMLNSSFSSDGGSFTISSMNVGDTIGSVVMSAMGGAINLTSSLVVASIPSSSQAIIESIDNSTGITLPGTFTISNTTSGVLIVTDSIYDNNTTTSGNSSSIIFSNIFTNPQSTTLSFTSTINSELGDVDVQTFLNTISCGIPFTPFVSVSLSNTDCDSLTDLTINNSQDPNEPDMLNSSFSSDGGSFTISSMNVGDTIGSVVMSAMGGAINLTSSLVVASIPSSSQAIIESIDNSTGITLPGTFTISNTTSGVLIVTDSIYDNNTTTSGNSSSIIFSNIFTNPQSTTLSFTSTINSELGDVDVQTFLNTISCGIPFTPFVSVSLSNTDCDSLTDLTINNSQDPNEPDMLNSSFSSDGGSFTISSMNVGDTIGSVVMSAMGGAINLTSSLVVASIPSSSQAIIESIDNSTGITLPGTFTISNTTSGVLIVTDSIYDNNTTTSGNSSSIIFSNIFTNPQSTTLSFTSTINSELGDVDVQTFLNTISCGIPFTPFVSVSLSNTDCDSLTDLTINNSQDPNEPDMLNSSFSSDGGSFTISSMNVGDTIGSVVMSAMGGAINLTSSLVVASIPSSSQAIIESIDNSTGITLPGTFTISNTTSGVLIVTDSIYDNNTTTSGNSSSIIFSNIFTNPQSTTLSFTSTINSELGDVDVQTFLNTISCGIPFTPFVSVSLSNTDCDSLTDLTINNSQDPNEPDMLNSSFSSDGGSFTISSMNVGDTIGSVVMSAMGGAINLTSSLVVASIPSSSQAIIESIDNSTGITLPGTFTISNTTSGVLIVTDSIYDNNTTTSGNSSSVTFDNIFVNPGAGVLTFTSTINSELGDINIQTFPFTVACLCLPTTSISNVTVCDSYTWNGTAYTASGTYTYLTTNSTGCDSTATLNLTINNSSTSTTSATACDSYTWNGIAYTASGTYTYLTTNSTGCDSTATLNLTINNSSTSTTSATACDSYTWNGIAYTASGTYTYLTTNSTGCDSTATLNLTINNSVVFSNNASICLGDSIMVGTSVYYVAGTYTDTLQGVYSCDSIVNTTITLNSSGCTDPTALNYDPVAICNDGSCIAIIYGCMDTLACNYFAGANIDDGSCVFSSSSISSATACDSYTWNGIAYTASGTYTYLTTNSTGCDSTATLNLTINNSSTSTTSATACDSYTWNGIAYTASGTYTYLTTNSTGCDSTATLNLTINNSSTSTTSATACDSYTWNGIAYTASGTYTYLTTNSTGCDSTATLNLTINNSVVFSNNASICLGDSIMVGTSVYYVAGTYTDTLQGVYSCDSIVNTTITLNSSGCTDPTALNYDPVAICNDGSCIAIIYGCMDTLACNYFAGANIDDGSCVFSSSSISSATACDSYTWNGIAYTASGTYTYLTTNSTGCDSTATLNLTINNSSTSTTSATACDSYTWNGIAYTASGTYTYLTTNSTGCDSTATLNLTINNSVVFSNNASICLGDSIMVGTSVYYVAGTYTDTLQGVYSCDSIVNTTITLNSSGCTDPTALNYDPVAICNDGSCIAIIYGCMDTLACNYFAGANIDDGSCVFSSSSISSATACDSYTWNGIAYTASGTYTYLTTNSTGCDSTATLNLTINNSSTSTTSATACDSYTWNGIAYTASGTYTYLTTNSTGCDSTATLNLTINNSSTSTTSATACDSYTWNGIAYTASGTYTYLTTNSTGCDSTATLNLTINNSVVFSNNASICLGDSIMVGTSVYYVAGTYTDTLQGVYSCDSIVNTTITLNSSGCTDPTALNYDPVAICNDGSCIAIIYGCMDTLACNYFAGANIDDGSCVFSSSSISSATACDSYTWNGIAYTASGTYTYLTTNSTGCDSTATLNLTINNSSTSTTSATACDSYTWNGIAYTASGAYTYTYTNAEGCDSIATLNLTINYSSISNTTITATNNYTWNGVIYDSSGIYTYTTINTVGCDSIATLNLTINVCDVPANVVTTNILLDRATLGWDAVVGAHHYQIRFKEVSGSTWLILDNYSTTRTKTGLSAGSNYHWQVRTLCDASGSISSPWSDTLSFSTPVVCTLPVSTTNITIGLDFTSFSWAAVTGVSEYIVRVKEVSGLWASWVYDTVTTNTYTAYNLNNTTNYHWQVRAACAPLGANNSGFTAYTNFTTLTPCTDPSLLTIDSVAVNGAYLSWSAPAGTDHFKVFYSELGTGVWNSATTTANSIALTGLATYSPYEWSVLAFCEATGLNNSDTIVGANFSTANPCTVPAGLVTSNILLDRITINWNTVALAHHYEIRVREQGTSIWTNIINVYGNSRVKTGLSASTTYEWEIRSICTANGSSFSDWSATQIATTLTPCTSVTNETTTNIALTSATLTWDASPGAYAYRLRFKESSAAWSAWQYDTILAPNNSMNKSGLSAGVNYHWQVQVICESSGLNNSGFTSYQNFTTIALCSNPHSLSVTQITLNSAKLIMYGPNNPDHYYVLYKDIAASTWDTVVLSGIDINGGYASKVVTGLSSSTTYEWKSQSSCQADDSNLSSFVNGPNFTTVTPCAIPSNLTATVSGQDAVFTWDAVAGTAFYTAKYRVLNGNWQTITNLTSPTYTATNLGFGLSIEWVVSSHCDWINMNYSSFSPADTFNTASCPTPQNIAVSNILTDRATISWTFSSSVHHYAVRAREAGTAIWTKNISHVFGGSRTVTGLSDGVVYEFQIRSACTNDTSNVSSWTSLQTFNTLANCNSKPTSLTTSNITLTSANLSFTGTANAVAYLVRFKDASAGWGAWVYDTLLAPTVSINKVGLTAGTYYHWQAKAICDLAGVNSSAWTSYKIFTTNQTCSTPLNLMVQNIYVTPVSASLRWHGQMNINYLLIFKDTTAANWDTLSISAGVVASVTTLPVGVSATSSSSGSVTDLAIDGLTPETSYEWQVISECSSYNTSAAVIGPLFTTLPPCTTPSGLSTTAISATTATLNWGATVTAHHYALRGRVQGTSVWAFDIPNQNNTNRTIHNLTAGQTYEWQVRSVCSNDTSEVSAWSSLQMFSTLVSCDNPPANLNETNIDLNTATLNWDIQTDAQAYEVRFKNSSASWSALVYTTLTATTLDKFGLSSSSGYHWQVRAICDTLNNVVSQWSPWGSFNTTTPCALPNNLMVLNAQTSLTSVSLRWYGPMNIDYYVMLKESGAANWDTVIVQGTTVTNVTLLPFGVNFVTSTAGSESNVTITGLSSATTYEWQIISACSGLNMSSAVTGADVTTLTGCAIPSNLSSTVVTSTATISWDIVPGAVKYDVRKKELGGTSWGYINNLTSTTRTMYGLTPGDTYLWEVRSHCDYSGTNISTWSSTQQFTTQVVCTKPVNPVENNIAGTTADLQWDAIPTGSWGYRLMYLKQGASWNTKVVDTVSTNIYNAIGLDVNTTYRWRVQGICDQSGLNNSNFTSFQYFTTLSSIRITAGNTELGENLNIYPNPTRGFFNISFIAEKVDNFEITIVDAFGKLVSHEDKQDFIGEYTKQVDLSDYPRGIYMVQIKTQDSFVSKRIVLQ